LSVPGKEKGNVETWSSDPGGDSSAIRDVNINGAPAARADGHLARHALGTLVHEQFFLAAVVVHHPLGRAARGAVEVELDHARGPEQGAEQGLHSGRGRKIARLCRE
jgi:hypothetical protein